MMPNSTLLCLRDGARKLEISQQTIDQKYSNAEKLFLFTIIVFPINLFPFRVLGYGVTIGRLCFLAVVCFFLPRLLRKGFRADSATVFGGLALVSIALSCLTPSYLDLDEFKFFAPTFVLGLLSFLFCYLVFVNDGKMIKAFRYVVGGWTVVITGFSIFSAVSIYVLNQIPLQDYLVEHQARVAASKRLLLPTSTPPHLSLYSTILSVWFVLAWLKTRRLLGLLVAAVMFGVCVLTYSRSGFVTLLLTGLVLGWAGSHWRVLNVRLSTFVAFLGILGLGWLFPTMARELVYLVDSDIPLRLLEYDVGELRMEKHYEYRVQSFLIFTNANPIEKLFGVGVGQFMRRAPESEDATYSFSIYLTALAELGLLGFTTLGALFLYPILSFSSKMNKCGRNRFPYFLGFALSLVLAIGNLFYEYKSFIVIWIVLGWVYALANSRREVVLDAFSMR